MTMKINYCTLNAGYGRDSGFASGSICFIDAETQTTVKFDFTEQELATLSATIRSFAAARKPEMVKSMTEADFAALPPPTNTIEAADELDDEIPF